MVSQTPGRSLGAAENQATYETYLQGWADLNQRLRLGEPWSGDERNVAFLNSGSRGAAFDFADAAAVLGLDSSGDGRSAARIDIDFDGDDDIVLTARTEPRVQVLCNRLADGVPGVSVRLEGTGKSGTEAIGGVVFATEVQDDDPEDAVGGEFFPGRTQRRTRSVGSGYLAQSSAWLRFAFPSPKEASTSRRSRRVRLAVRWPRTGRMEEFGTVRLGRKRFVLKQGEGVAREVNQPDKVRFDGAELPAFDLDPSAGRRLALPAPSSIPSLAARGASGRAAQLFGLTPDGPRGAGQPVIVLAWDSSAPDSIVGLGAVGDLCKEAKEAGALVVSIDLAAELEEPPFPAQLNKGAALLASAGFDGDELGAIASTASTLAELVAWRLDTSEAPPLPWSLVVGADGRLDAVRTGPWRVGEAAKDFAFCKTRGNARLLLASPFGGRWVAPPLEADLAQLQARLQKRGLSEAVRELDLARLTTVPPTSAEVQLRLGQTYLNTKEYDKALKCFDNALVAEPESVLALRARAYTLQVMDRFPEAMEAWAAAIDLEPGDVNSRVNRAFAAINAGELEVAERELEVLVAATGAGSEKAGAVARALAAAREKE